MNIGRHMMLGVLIPGYQINLGVDNALVDIFGSAHGRAAVLSLFYTLFCRNCHPIVGGTKLAGGTSQIKLMTQAAVLLLIDFEPTLNLFRGIGAIGRCGR